MNRQHNKESIAGPEGEHTELLHDVQFPGLIEVKDVREKAWVSVKIKLLLLHVVVVTNLKER